MDTAASATRILWEPILTIVLIVVATPAAGPTPRQDIPKHSDPVGNEKRQYWLRRG